MASEASRAARRPQNETMTTREALADTAGRGAWQCDDRG